MKQYWQKIATRIDALTLRERAIIFALATLVLILGVNAFILDPLFAKQKALSVRMKTDQAKITDIQRQIQSTIQMAAIDPDAENRARLQMLVVQLKDMQSSLQDIQKGLIAPEKMANLLENILRRNSNLRLVSLKTLAPSNITEGTSADNPSLTQAARTVTPNQGKPADGTQASGLVYKHGVEITVQGNYLDMVNYMAELEAMPSELFWSKVVLNAEDHAKTTLTLTLYTLSLDKQWLNI